MAITSFIPEVWSARILENMRKNLVYVNLLNRNYEGEISEYGDTVHIASLNDVTIKTYSRTTDLADPEDLTTADQTLVIDQGDYFNMKINDVDRVQARADLMDEAMRSASYGLSDKADQYVAGLLKAGTITANLGNDTKPLVITKDNAYETMVTMRTALDKANVPKQGRWIVMPPEFEGFMLLDPRFAYNTSESNTRLVEGSVARAAGFDIYISNNVPNTSAAKYKVISSTNACGTYADQILKTEAYRREKGFDDGVKGLHVYGAKITRPAIVAVATVNFTAAAG